MRQVHKDGSEVGHRWERMGAVAPYRYVGYSKSTYQACQGAPVQAGTTCDYCGTAIINVFTIKDSTGKEFKLGSDCINHLNDSKLVVIVESEVRKINAKNRYEAEQKKILDLTPTFEKAIETLKNFPHPNSYFASKGKTLADYALYLSRNSKNMKWAINQAEKKGKSNV